MFVGLTLLGSARAAQNVPDFKASINTITLKNMYVREILATTYRDGFKWRNNGSWDYGTILHTIYKDNLSGGNISLSSEVVSEIRIKKRLIGDSVWKTIYLKDNITNPNDFNISFVDYLEPSNSTVEYKYVPVFKINNKNIDMDSEGTIVESKFNNYFLIGQYEVNSDNQMVNEVHPMIIDFTNTTSFNGNSTTVKTLGSKYPFVITNGITKYYSGNTTCTFIELCVNGENVDVENGWKYRNTIDYFLKNGYAKLMKSFEGNMWLISVNDDISHQMNGHYQNVSTSFAWVEIGDPFSVGDLYDNGFINTDIDRSLDE